MKFEPRTVELKNGFVMTIDEAKPEDAAELIDYIGRVGRETDNLVVDEDGLGFTEEQERSFLQSMRERDDAIMLNGKVGDVIVSTSQIGRNSPRFRTRHIGTLAITISKSHWGLGAGTAVIGALFDFARSIGIEVVELDVKADNERAIGLYKKMGFEITGTHHKAMRFKDGTYRDTYLMQAFL